MSSTKAPRVTPRKRAQRLRRELNELLNNPVDNCSAFPLDGQIDVWHANIYVPALDVHFHFEITYPKNYPNKAPKVKNLTHISHNNVFSSYICLDILTMSEETANTPFRGWTSAYTISSLLVQLQSFLFEAVAERNATRMKQEALSYRCAKCPHHGNGVVFPEITCMVAKPGQPKWKPESVAKAFAWEFLEEVPVVVIQCLCTFLEQSTVTSIRFLCDDKDSKKAIDGVLKKIVYKCFYTLKDLNDDEVVLGLGAKKDIMPRRSRKTGRKAGQLQRLHCSFDYVSHEAYEMGVRNNVWKDRDFDSFIPLVINSKHAQRSIPLAEKYIMDIWSDKSIADRPRTLTDNIVLETLSKLMNTTVVNMMKTVEDLEAGEIQLFDSIKALEGYTSFHHLLLAFVHKYPSIKHIANEKVRQFINNKLYRDKEVTPDMGEMLVNLAISDYSWDDFCPAWLEEGFLRNARWICTAHPGLLKLEGQSSCVRMNRSWAATRTGKRLAMFQRFFLTQIACPDRLVGNPNKCEILLKEYNLRFGFPEESMAMKLQEHSRKVIACTNWFDYFRLIDFCPPSAARLSAWLRNSLVLSGKKEYHSDYWIKKYPDNFKTRVDDKLHFDQMNCICTGSLFRINRVGYCPSIAPGAQQGVLVKKEKTGIDICFVLDCTGSMGSWISSAKRQIKNIMNKVGSQCDGKVRFATVGYHDHSDSTVIKRHDFTSSLSKAQGYVDGFHAKGGGDYPEAMCCAMAEAHSLTWNRDSHQLLILIADAPPHGLGASGDSYCDGCPCGEDTLRVVHTMAKTGIVIYPVDCGSSDSLRQTFFHALARITGGYALEMDQAHLLPEIVLGATQEEKAMHRLKKKIQPIYTNCLENHAIGRFEQHCRSVFSELTAKNVTVKSVLPPDDYSRQVEHQVECMEFCMDLKQAKIMAEKEYFIPFRRSTKLRAGSERPVTLAQVTKCMKRMKTKMLEFEFQQNGCSYLNSQKFTEESFKSRWTSFKSNRKLKAFQPWNSIKPATERMYSKVPDKSEMITHRERSLGSCLMGAKKAKSLLPLIGQEVEVKIDDCWMKVKILTEIKGRGKVKVLDPEGFTRNIPLFSEFRQPKSTFEGWAQKRASDKPAVRPPSRPDVIPSAPTTTVPTRVDPPMRPTPPVGAIGDRVRSVAMERNVSKEVQESEIAHSRALAEKPSSTDSGAASADLRTRRERSSSRPRTCPFQIGQIVNVRNSNTEAWALAKICMISADGLNVQASIDGSPAIAYRQMAPAATREFYTCEGNTAVYSECRSTEVKFFLKEHTCIQIVEFRENWVHIVSPVEGWIIGKKNDGVKVIKSAKMFKQEQEEAAKRAVQINTQPTIIIDGVPSKCTAAGLARKCSEMRLPAMPTNIRLLQGGVRRAVVSFDNVASAEHCFRVWSTSITMKVYWEQRYLLYRTENAL